MRYHGGSFWVENSVIDFSSNLNPLGPPPALLESLNMCWSEGVIFRYPDYNYAKLREAIGLFYDIEPRLIVPCNGASEALGLGIQALQPRTVVVVSPSYGDYDLMCGALGIRCIHHVMKRAAHLFRVDLDELLETTIHVEKPVIVITNPNNPTGTYIPARDVVRLAEELGEKGWVMVDESYSEISGVPDLLSTPAGMPDNIVVVRSFTKVFSIPGLRAGFLYTPSKMLARTLDQLRPTWNVNSLAECALSRALTEHHKVLWRYIGLSQKLVKVERAFLIAQLERLGYKVYRSATNFLLIEHPWIEDFYLRDMLLEKFRLLVRPASTFHGLTHHHTRISVRLREENEMLVRALEEARGSG